MRFYIVKLILFEGLKWARQSLGEAQYKRPKLEEHPMMKLYYSRGACSLSPHIILRELGFDFELEQVDLRAKTTKGGEDYKNINPKGYVPALRLDNGQTITEGPAILQYLADQKPDKGLCPPAGTLERARLNEWLNYISTEVHKGMSPLFSPQAPEEWKTVVRERVAQRLDYTEEQLNRTPYLLGNHFTLPDAYLFTVLRWAKGLGIDLAKWPSIRAFMARIDERPAVRAAISAEL